MKDKLNKFKEKNWETVDIAKGGYVETNYEYFEEVYDIPLMKHKDAKVWYIGRLRNNEFIKPENVLKDKTQALITFEKVKNFQKSEVSSHSFDSMSSDALESWILDYGHNPYVGLSIHSSDAERAYQSKMQNKQESQMIRCWARVQKTTQ